MTLLQKWRWALTRDDCPGCQTAGLGNATWPPTRFLCPACQEKLGFSPAVRHYWGMPVYSAMAWHRESRQSVYQHKFRHPSRPAPLLAAVLGQLWATVSTQPAFAQALPRWPGRWIISWLPPHPGRVDHVAPWARPLCHVWPEMRAQPEVLRWRAASEVQVQHHLPSRRDRWANMQTAWQRNPNVQLPKAVGILLVDDLLTSGATMASALRTLQQADPGRPVLGLTLVHVPWRQGAPIDAPTTRPTE